MNEVTFVEKYIKPWFFSSKEPDRIKPIRVAISFFLGLFTAAIIIKFLRPDWLSDMLVLGLIGNIGIFLGADTFRSNSKDKRKRVLGVVIPGTIEKIPEPYER